MYDLNDSEAYFNYCIHLASKLDIDDIAPSACVEHYQSFIATLQTPCLNDYRFMLSTHQLMASIYPNWYKHLGIRSILTHLLNALQYDLTNLQDTHDIEILESLAVELKNIPIACKLLSTLIEQIDEAILSEQTFNDPDFFREHKNMLSFLDDDPDSPAFKLDSCVNKSNIELHHFDDASLSENESVELMTNDSAPVTSKTSSTQKNTANVRKVKPKKEKKKEKKIDLETPSLKNSKVTSAIPQAVKTDTTQRQGILLQPQKTVEEQQKHSALIEERRRAFQERIHNTPKQIKRATRESKWIKRFQNNAIFQAALFIFSSVYKTLLFIFETFLIVTSIFNKSFEYLVIRPYQFLIHPMVNAGFKFSDHFLNRLTESSVLRFVLTLSILYKFTKYAAPEPESKFLKFMQMEQLSNFFLSMWITGPLSILYLRRFYVEGKIITKYKNEESLSFPEVIQLIEIKSKEGKTLIFDKNSELGVSLETYFRTNKMSHLSKKHLKPN